MTDRKEDRGSFERLGGAVGGLAGKLGDTTVNVVGSMIRTVAGAVGGWWSDRTPDEALASFGERQDETCRRHFENSARRPAGTYETVRPLYQFGHLAGQNPDYQGRSFEDVEPDLRSAWTGDQARRYGAWSSVRDYINTGYMTRRSRGGNLP
ncbi:MAG: hypothetical protein ACT443_08685 [Gemmatimonadota bacterium]